MKLSSHRTVKWVLVQKPCAHLGESVMKGDSRKAGEAPSPARPQVDTPRQRRLLNKVPEGAVGVARSMASREEGANTSKV